MTSLLNGWGIQADLPSGWEGRITHRAAPSAASSSVDPPAGVPGAAAPLRGDPPVGSDGWPTEQMHPVVHLANFPLPPNRGDYGSGAVERMGAADALIVLFEFGPESLGTALFRPRGLPRTVRPVDFSPNALQRRLPGQLGFQTFFTEAGRTFSLYVVLGAQRNATPLCNSCTTTLSATRIEAR